MLKHLIHRCAALTLVLSGIGTPEPPDVPTSPLSLFDKPDHDLSQLPPTFTETAEWAIELFDAAGLELPPTRFEHHGPDTTPCFGRVGAHLPSPDGSVIRICTTQMTGAVEVMILHELAHAWSDSFLGPEPKASFQELRGWEHWRNYEAAPWHENGTEQAAEFLVWGLLDRPYSMVRINHSGCDELQAGFEVLTGTNPLHGFRDKC